MKKMKYTALFLAAFAAASCEKSSTVDVDPPETGPSAALTAVIEAAPDGEASPIHMARQTIQPGDKVTVSGQVMGNEHPFVEGRAAFILGDPAVLTPCNEKPDDGCETPWDACCDTPEDKKRGTATIQIVDADGRVLKESIEGVGGIGNLAKLIVSGTVAEGSSTDALVINASAIEVER
ncbi:hypothetical protein [Haloferula sp. A504]|uniref:hypothetical protein n=1 Tax=Haloferula sp. A504 TaxID=3373601 RepID=UPI0031C30373|nr:hypothetical protein [Verrucomicrobiaceae bacterium E54]